MRLVCDGRRRNRPLHPYVVIGVRVAGPLCGSPCSREAVQRRYPTQCTSRPDWRQCYRSIDSAAVPVWMLMALGLGLVLTGGAVRIVGIHRPVARPGT